MRHFIAVLGIILTSAGCADNPAGPSRESSSDRAALASADGETVQECGENMVCGSTPIPGSGGPSNGGGGGGDGTPYYPGTGECMASGGFDADGEFQTLQGCYLGGPTRPLPGPTDSGLTAQDTVPNCNVAQTAAWARAYCRSAAPVGTNLTAVEAALARIEQRGPACASIAARGRVLLSTGQMRVFTPVQGDAGGWGNATVGVLISSDWITYYATTPTSDNRNLDHTVAHEIEHNLGREHIDTAGYETPNSRTCSGLPGTSP